MSLTLTELQSAQFDLPPPPKRPIFGPVATSDGFVMLAVASERSFQGLARAAGRADWITDPRFASYMDRRSNWAMLMDEFEAWSRNTGDTVCHSRPGRRSRFQVSHCPGDAGRSANCAPCGAG